MRDGQDFARRSNAFWTCGKFRPLLARMRPDDILPTYDRVARGFARSRDRTLFERRWLDRALNHAPGRRVLDLGCGPGKPIAAYLQERNGEVTGVDGAGSMLVLFRDNLPRARAVHADMRGLDLGETFDLILAWNSMFHLSADDQRGMFATFAAHARPRTALLFTTGPAAGEAMGRVEGESVYHASLDPDEYRKLLNENGFDEVAFVPEDPTCNGHSVWLAQYRGLNA
ncbi:methyltransferase family protein [Maritimibacter alkaliphilus HTCC2654]|uniref:Putative methyltransferase n=2 Tax=Maritimibacter TaxID=404235 RepID=A3VDZ3_9RHOB|nr:putative methyltransferase [Maritimibacter alkaliphilus HTCC2654]TYP83568.1 methyltransferase family protein [Maritimibacter alkaliphilus HTCC2654]